jgi:hypothetical protein
MKDIFTGIIYFPLNMVNCVHIFVVISLSRVIEFYMVASLVEYWCGVCVGRGVCMVGSVM